MASQSALSHFRRARAVKAEEAVARVRALCDLRDEEMGPFLGSSDLTTTEIREALDGVE